MPKGKYVAESEVTLSEVMMPNYANHYGSVHGGDILKLVDEAAFVAATKHARMNVLLASMDHIVFKHPVNIGDLLIIKASLCYAGRTSMEIEVDIKAEKIKEGKVVDVGSACLTMVAVDKHSRPARVPELLFRTPQEIRKSRQGLARRKERLSR